MLGSDLSEDVHGVHDLHPGSLVHEDKVGVVVQKHDIPSWKWEAK